MAESKVKETVPVESTDKAARKFKHPYSTGHGYKTVGGISWLF